MTTDIRQNKNWIGEMVGVIQPPAEMPSSLLSGLTTKEVAMKDAIQTASGKAMFVETVVEDANGKWNDNWNVRDGFYVIHRGTEHDVYRLLVEEEY